MIALLSWAACALASGPGAVTRQSVRLEVIPAVEAGLNPLSESTNCADADQTTTDEVEFGLASLVVSPGGYDAKVTVTSEPGTRVEVGVEANAEDGGYPEAALRLTLTDP
jgi:hypothetical protein